MKKLISIFLIGLLLLAFGSGVVNVKADIITKPAVNVTLRAIFEPENIVSTPDISGAYGSTLSMDSSLATLENYTFAFWIVNGTVRKDLPIDHPFVLTKDIAIDAIFSTTGENAVVFMDSNGKLIDVQYVLDNGNATDIVSGLPDKPNYIISVDSKWDLPLTNITTDTVRVLQYEIDTTDSYTLTVTGGTGSGSYLFNSIATASATPEEGQVFHYWQIGNEIVSYDESYALTLFSDLTVEAVYGDEAIAALPVVSISQELSLRTSKSSFVGQMYIPTGFTLIEYGMMTSPLECECIYLGDSVSTEHQANKNNGQTGEYLMTFTTLDIGHVAAYMILKDDLDDLYHYQSEQIRIPGVNSNEPVLLNTAEDFVILTKTGISTSGTTSITGNIGVSPGPLSYITGFSLELDVSGTFATSTLIVGRAYGSDLTSPTPAYLDDAITDMETAFADAASRTPDCLNLNSGDISGRNLSPGVFKFDAGVLINTDLTLTGSATDIWIFQIGTTLGIAADVTIVLAGGALPENIIWQVGTAVTIGADVNFSGTILAATAITVGSGSEINGRLLTQTSVTLISNNVH